VDLAEAGRAVHIAAVVAAPPRSVIITLDTWLHQPYMVVAVHVLGVVGVFVAHVAVAALSLVLGSAVLARLGPQLVLALPALRHRSAQMLRRAKRDCAHF